MKFLLYPLSIVYNLITSLRNLLFDLGLINPVQYKIPTIGVGNLSTGGTGKSILVDYLIELLKIKYRITTLSRGYNRDTSGFIQATSKSSAYEIGDEPYQFYSKHPEINVVVCEDRRKGMKLILNNLPNTEISIWDDVFQHRYVKPGLMLLTTTFKYPYYQDEVLPIGNLRENKSSSKRADLIIVTKCPDELSYIEKLEFLEKLSPDENQKVFFSTISYKKNLKSDDSTIHIDNLREEEFILVTGIADSSYLVKYLNNKNLKFKHLKYSDHYNFKKPSIDKILSISRNKKIITTEKDYGRLKPKINRGEIYYLEVSIEFPNNLNKISFDEVVYDFVENY